MFEILVLFTFIYSTSAETLFYKWNRRFYEGVVIVMRASFDHDIQYGDAAEDRVVVAK